MGEILLRSVKYAKGRVKSLRRWSGGSIMSKATYEFQFTFLEKKVQMFHAEGMGVVVEKEPDVVCVYGTDDTNNSIYCAVQLCHPKMLKGITYRVTFYDEGIATVSAGDKITVHIDFQRKKCANSRDARSYGSAAWGQDVSEPWCADFAMDQQA